MLEREWNEKQDALKLEKIEVTYSYWDGSGHRYSVVITKGTRIDEFLNTVRLHLQNTFPELRNVNADNLLYVKEDVIIPHHYTFYDLLITRARGRTGPLFHFDVHDDLRVEADHRVEKDESHAGKVVTRTWYERNKHIYPATRWRLYDHSIHTSQS
uniref:Protein FAM50 homolog n=1 Tax=Lygus hesperus TaxID=30085 RepID=A0A0A9XJH9_LYGHE